MVPMSIAKSDILIIIQFFAPENVPGHEAGFTFEREQNANVACKNEAIVQCGYVTNATQTAFGSATNIRRTVFL